MLNILWQILEGPDLMRRWQVQARAFLIVALARYAPAGGESKLRARSATFAATRRRRAQSNAPFTAGPEFLHRRRSSRANERAASAYLIKEPLKKSLRSKQEIREYLVREDGKTRTRTKIRGPEGLEAFGLIPKISRLDSFMLDVLTDQVAGPLRCKSQGILHRGLDSCR